MNGLLDLFVKIKEDFDGDFLITKEVKEEIIDKPLTIKKFELEALRLEALFKKGIIKHADITHAQIEELRVIRDRLLQEANAMFSTHRGALHILDKGEAAAFALSVVLRKKINQPIPLVIDERTARVLCENPDNLKKLFEKKFKTAVRAERRAYASFQDFRVIRSSELAYIAYKRKLIDSKDSRFFEGILYGLKFHGCAITEEEIEEMKALVR
jgi:hypothetical protein